MLLPLAAALFAASGVRVESARSDADHVAMGGVVTRVHGDALARPAVPADAVAASGSNPDPHVGPACAAPQLPRTGLGCGLSEQVVGTLVIGHTDGRAVGLLGEPGVNVPPLAPEFDARR